MWNLVIYIVVMVILVNILHVCGDPVIGVSKVSPVTQILNRNFIFSVVGGVWGCTSGSVIDSDNTSSGVETSLSNYLCQCTMYSNMLLGFEPPVVLIYMPIKTAICLQQVKLFHANQTCYLLAIVVNNIKNVVRLSFRTVTCKPASLLTLI